jgi:hypothetical protein
LSKHNQRVPNADHVVHYGRPRLICRWRPDPTTRKPLCGWEIDGSEAAPLAEPLSGWQADQVFALVAFCQIVAWPWGRLNSEQGAKHGYG